jgi:hypothetical protein
MDRCDDCGAPYEAKRKWNSGNPAVFWFPTCDCAEKRQEVELERLIEGIRRRRREGRSPDVNGESSTPVEQ